MKTLEKMLNEQNDKADEVSLEKLLDATSVPHVLGLLSQICTEKAEHLRVNWDDKPQADAWEKAAVQLDKMSELRVFNDLP